MAVRPRIKSLRIEDQFRGPLPSDKAAGQKSYQSDQDGMNYYHLIRPSQIRYILHEQHKETTDSKIYLFGPADLPLTIGLTWAKGGSWAFTIHEDAPYIFYLGSRNWETGGNNDIKSFLEARLELSDLNGENWFKPMKKFWKFRHETDIKVASRYYTFTFFAVKRKSKC